MATREIPGIHMLLAENLKTYRSRIGLSQQKLAEIVGLSTNFVGQIELGRKFPSPEVFERIAKCLGVKPADLLSEGQIEALSPAQLRAMVTHLRDTMVQQLDQAIDAAFKNIE